MINSKDYKTLFILIFIACLPGFAADIYTPSFFSMSKSLQSTVSDIQRSMSIFMVSLAATQLIYGPLSEATGRRPVLLIGLSIMLIGTLICTYAYSFEMLMIGRFVQGAGAGACACLWRAIFRDIFTGPQMAKYAGYIGVAMVYIVAAAPFFGGVFEVNATWRLSFISVAAYGMLIFAVIYFVMPETNIHHSKDRLSWPFFKSSCGQLLKSNIFMGYATCVLMTYGAFFSWIVVGPVICIKKFDITPDSFGFLNMVIGGTSMATGILFNSKLMSRFGQVFMLKMGWGLMFISAGTMILLSFFEFLTLSTFLSCIFVTLFGTTLIWPNALSKAFTPFGSIAGYAAALYSSMQLGGGAIVGWISSLMPNDNVYPLAIVIMSASVASIILLGAIENKK